MRRRLEQLVPWGVFLGFAATALAVNLLLSDARDKSLDALVESLETEINALASTQDQRFLTSLAAAGGFVQEQEFDFEVGSDHDGEVLGELADLATTLRAGFYLVDLEGTVTEGVALEDENVIGSTFEWPGFSPESVARGGMVLPVADGLTTTEPAFATVLTVLDPDGTTPIGGLVVEQVVDSAGDFNQEIGVLERGETGEYLVFDPMGTVIAANNPSAVAEPVDDPALMELPAGTHRIDGRIVTVADVPSTGWRVAFRQDVDEFESSLARPLESVGIVVVFLLLLAGFLLTFVLYRRLRDARAEQERLRRLNESQQEFVSIVSHELRTPVAGVLGFLETSLDHWDAMSDEERLSAVSRAAVNARRLQAMTRDVLDTESLEAGRLVHVLEPLDLAAAVESAVQAAQELGEDRAFELTVPEDPVWVQGDVDRLQQVLANLLENAVKNSPAVEPIEVEVRLDGSEAHVSVADHGTGIEADSVERIFDKFVRGRGDSVSGSGLGLYISRQIINAHDGRIWAESERGRGAVFHFVLPLIEAPESRAEAEVVNT